MEQKKTKIYLNYISDVEKKRMTEELSFLRTGDEKSKEKFLKTAEKLYGSGIKLEFGWDNGHYPSEWNAVNRSKDKHFYIVMQFERKAMSGKGIEALGENDKEWDWRYFYGIALCNEDRKMYAISYSNQYVPNWNQDYWVQRYVELETVDYPIIDGLIFRMDDALHAAINDKLAKNKPLFVEKEGEVIMTVKDQHGNYMEITGTSLEAVFRNYADYYTGYRNFRRQMASEWEIVDDAVRERYNEWKKTAKGLKSDFDKFYGGGIVD